jgi:hypothetical protein
MRLKQEVERFVLNREIKTKKALLATFDLMIVLVTNKLIMRSKLKRS